MTNTQKQKLISTLQVEGEEYGRELEKVIDRLDINEIRRISTKIVIINQTIESIKRVGVNLTMWHLLNEMTDNIDIITKLANSYILELYINITSED